MVINKVDINEQTQKEKSTPLILAVKNRHLLVARFLIQSMADVDLENREGKRAKDYAETQIMIVLLNEAKEI